MEIRLFSQNDADKVISLWKRVFGDSEEFIRGFLNVSSPNMSTLLTFCDEELCAVINFPEISLAHCGKIYKGIYLFAVCVDEKYRNRGVFRKMSEKIDEIALSRGYTFAMLIPSEKGLFDMYKRAGYTKKCVSAFPCEVEIDVNGTSLDVNSLYEKYRSRCIRENAFIKDKGLFIASVLDKLSEGCELGEIDGEYVIYKKDGKKTVVFDTSISDFSTDTKRFGLYKTYTDINFGENIKFSMFFEI